MKYNKKSKKKKQKEAIEQPILPQNILPIGERVLDNKNIYIHQKVYKQIHKFAANKTENEHGGILVGRVVNEIGKENTIIEGFIEAKNNVATPTTLTFTQETWNYFHEEIARKYKDKAIVGWIHTHPNFGIFLSENDKFIQENFFTNTNHVAYVVDPIQNDEGFFFWVDGKLERCPGFYLFDKNGSKIKTPKALMEEVDEEKPSNKSDFRLYVLLVVIIINALVTIFQADKIKSLEKKYEDVQRKYYELNQYVQLITGGIRIIEPDDRNNNNAIEKNKKQETGKEDKNQKEKQNKSKEEQKNNTETTGDSNNGI